MAFDPAFMTITWTVVMVRGGSWDYIAGNARSTYRGRNSPDDRDIFVGVRLAQVPGARKKEAKP